MRVSLAPLKVRVNPENGGINPVEVLYETDGDAVLFVSRINACVHA